MFNRENIIKSVSDSLAILIKGIEYRNQNSLFDINIFAESFVEKLLNILNDWNLSNMNHISKNFPYADLVDSKNKILVQVTSEKNSNKIQNTLDGFIKNSYQNSYDSLFVFIITKKQKQYKNLVVDSVMKFDSKTNIIDFSDIVNRLSMLSLDKLQKIDIELTKELNFHGISIPSKVLDKEVLQTIRDYLNRGALKDEFSQEGSMHDFFAALNDIVKALTTGNYGKILSKSIYEFDDSSLKSSFDATHHRFLSLRQLYISSVRKGEINPDNGFIYFHYNSEIPKIFNQLRREITRDLNDIFVKYSIPEIILSY